MKRIVLSAAFAMGVLIASAQTVSGTNTTNSKDNVASRVSTDIEIRQRANQLQLNEGKYIIFRDLSKARNEQLSEAQNMYANDAAALTKRVQAINQTFETQLAQNLSQSQFTAYLETQGRVPSGSGSQAAGYGGVSLEGGAATGTSTNGGAVNNNASDTNLNNASEANKPMIMDNEKQGKRKADKERRKNKRSKKAEY